jgi:hypothetical protein
MSSKTLCVWVRVAVLATAICGLVVCGYIVPFWGAETAHSSPELERYFLPWLILIWAAVIPVIAVLVFVWKVSTAIATESVFTAKTAKWIHASAVLLFCDVGLFFVGNIIFVQMQISHPGIFLLSLLVDILGVALAVLAAVLSRYITKAAELQDAMDGTI